MYVTVLTVLMVMTVIIAMATLGMHVAMPVAMIVGRRRVACRTTGFVRIDSSRQRKAQ